MVNFGKQLAGKKTEVVIDPIKLYDTLDRSADKGPLRPSQEAVLKDWFSSRRKDKDVIVKLHTGQGKTLIGLLMLQSRLNEKKAPVLYLCPNNFLVEQTCEQATKFGIKTCTTEGDLPNDFIDAKSIFVTSVHKLFNGMTKFGLHNKSIAIDTILMDDAHACADTIRSQCRIRLPRTDAAYQAILSLFSSDLESQGVGTFAEISSKKYGAILPVPYWSWLEKEGEVAKILVAGMERKPIKYAWPLLRDSLKHCQCIVSGGAIEIEPYIPPIHAFRSYTDAAHRIFMSATVTDDSFLIKGLQLIPETITIPLTYDKETWSGEKMILIPSLIHDELNRTEIVHLVAPPNSKGKYGRVVLAPSTDGTKDWATLKSQVVDTDTLPAAIEDLKQGKYEKTVVLVNRYDGIDLPDNACRLLVFDSKPYSESLIDLYQEKCRPNSEASLIKTVRTIEQGLGRSVRGEKDYSVVIITGPDLTRFIRDKNSKAYLSSQMAAQIEIGIEIAEMAQEDLVSGTQPMEVLKNLIDQCIIRDQEWKAFYIDKMNKVKPKGPNEHILRIYAAELSAEKKYLNGDSVGAADDLQLSLDNKTFSKEDKAWYFQEMARYKYQTDRIGAQKQQLLAYNTNRLLLKPLSGVTFAKLSVVSHGRMERIIEWIGQFENYEQLNIAINDILGALVFGGNYDKFEQALDELSRALGFKGERPDSELKEGPDNLWALDKDQYILWECKNEVDILRSEISKGEASQMNSSCAWFGKYYSGSKVNHILIHPARKLGGAAAFTHHVEVMQDAGLKSMVKRIKGFFNAFEAVDLKDLSAEYIQKLIDGHLLTVGNFLKDFTKPVVNLKD
jgi:replicative superfamily II helicase